MKKILLWGFVGIVGFFYPVSWAQPADPFIAVAEILPVETLMLAGLPRPVDALKRLSESNLGQIWSEAEVQEWFQSVLEKSFPEPFADLDAFFRQFNKILACFDEGIYFAGIWAPEKNKYDPFQKLFILQSSHAEKLQQFVALTEKQLFHLTKTPSYAMILKRRTRNDIEWVEILLPRKSYFYGMNGNTFVFGEQYDIVLKTLERLKNRSISNPVALSQDASFLEASESVQRQGDELFWGYFDLEKLTRYATNQGQWNFLSLLLGVDKIKIITTVSRIVSNQWEDQTVVRFKDSTHWIASLPSNDANSWAAADICPENTVFFASFKLIPSVLMQGFREQMISSMGERQVEQFLNEFKQRFQFSLMEDFMGLLGEEFSVFVSLPQYGFLPQAGMMVPVRQPEVFFQFLEKLFANQSEYTLNSLDYLNHRLYYLTEKYDFFPRWNPAFTYLQDHFVISYNVSSLKALLKVHHAGEKSLIESESWKMAFQKRPEPHQALGYINTKQIFIAFYEIFSQFVSVVSLRDLPFHPLLLPDTETIAQHLNTSATFIDYQKNAIQSFSCGDGFFPSTFALGFLGLLTGETFWEFYEQVSKVEKEVIWYLENYCHLLITPANETQPAQWIKDLNAMFRFHEMSPWVSPFDPSAASDNKNYCSYDYFPEQTGISLPVSSRWDSPSFKYYVLYDKKPFYNGGRFVLLANRTVQFVPEEEFQRELQKQIQEFKK